MKKQQIIDDLLKLDLPIGLWSKVADDKSEREIQLNKIIENERQAIFIMDEIDKEKLHPNEVIRVSFFYNENRTKSDDIAAAFFSKMPSYLEPIKDKMKFDHWVFPHENMVVSFKIKN